jgi:ADP-ribose pyrophosphatase
MDFKQISRKEIYHGRVFDVYQDEVQLPNGRVTRLDVVGHEPAVTILPLDEQGQVWLIRQFRYPVGESLLELPAGLVEPGEAMAACAARELREEIGMSAEQLTPIGGFYLAPGYSSEYIYAFLARGLQPAPLPPDDDEFIEVVKFPLDEVYRMLAKGELRDAKTIAAISLARTYLA